MVDVAQHNRAARRSKEERAVAARFGTRRGTGFASRLEPTYDGIPLEHANGGLKAAAEAVATYLRDHRGYNASSRHDPHSESVAWLLNVLLDCARHAYPPAR